RLRPAGRVFQRTRRHVADGGLPPGFPPGAGRPLLRLRRPLRPRLLFPRRRRLPGRVARGVAAAQTDADEPARVPLVSLPTPGGGTGLAAACWERVTHCPASGSGRDCNGRRGTAVSIADAGVGVVRLRARLPSWSISRPETIRGKSRERTAIAWGERAVPRQ